MIRVRINGNEFEGFDNVSLNLLFDAVASTFSLDGYFDPGNPDHRKLYAPLAYNEITFHEDDTLLLTGTILCGRYVSGPANTLVPLSGYSKTGILQDVSVPPDLYPLETNNKTLKEITERLLEPFGIELVLADDTASDANKLYTSSTAPSTDSIAGYLSELAAQRNIILSHNAAGDLVFARPRKRGSSIATYIEDIPSLSMELSVDGQGMHSEVTVLRQGSVDSELDSDKTRSNPLVKAYRPLVKEQTRGGNGDTDKATDKALASELSAVTLKITSDRWSWFDGKRLSVITPNNFVSVAADSLFLGKGGTWFVRAATLTESAGARNAVLDCVLPEAVNGDDPINPFAI